MFSLFYFFIGIRSSEDKILIGKEEVVFKLQEVQKSVDRDFPEGSIPIYDNAFCKKKYNEIPIHQGEFVEQCEIRSIKTFSRLNPLVIEVDCVCFK